MSSNDVKERRSLCPSLVLTIIGQLWPTIEHLKTLNQTLTLDKLKAHMYKKYRMTSSDCEKLVTNALKDKLIVESKPNNEESEALYDIPKESQSLDNHDWYCFVCHKPGPIIECVRCWRVLHSYCTKQTIIGSEEPFHCDVCRDFEKESDGMVGKRLVSIPELNQLLGYAFNRLNTNKELDITKDIKDQPYINQLLYHKIDLSYIQDKTKKNSYKKLIEFSIDVQTLIHCLTLLHTNDDLITGLAAKTMADTQNDLNEMRDCLDCYRQSNQKQDKSWFCRPCNPPHELVFAKMKGFPFWPAKVIKRIPETNEYYVRFFGEFHENWTIGEESIKPIDSTLQQLKISKISPPLNAALKELKQYQNNLQSTTGANFNNTRSPVRTPSAKRPRKRADGTRPRKRQMKFEIKTESSDQNETTNDSLSVNDSQLRIDSEPTLNQTSTLKPFVKSPIRTRNRGLKVPFQTKPTELDAKKSPPKARRSLQRTSIAPKRGSVGRPPKKSKPVSPKKVVANRRTKKAINGLPEDFPTQSPDPHFVDDKLSSKRLKSDDSEHSLARSRPVRQIKPNSRFKSPEIEVKIPRRTRTERIRIKNEPKDLPSNENEFKDDSINYLRLNDDLVTQLESQAKDRKVIANKSQVSSAQGPEPSFESAHIVSQSVLNGPTSLSTTSKASPVNHVSPIVSPRRGRPKGVKNKSTLEKLGLQGLNATKAPIKTSQRSSAPRKSLTVRSPNCNCRPKWEKLLKTVKDDLETQYKEETKKLKKDLESVKQVNYRLENDILNLKQKHLEEIADVKRKQWCAVCQKESIYYCCWNTSYCSVECQQQHWTGGHKKSCRRNLNQSKR